MIALQIESTREFLKLLLEGSEFDSFQVGRLAVTTFITFTTDGRRRQTVYDDEEMTDGDTPAQPGTSGKEQTERVTWRELKPTVIGMIRQASVPGTLELDLFKYRSRDMGSIRIAFEDGKFILTTGYMQKEFSLDHRGSEEWDDTCQTFLTRNGILVTAL